MRISLIGFFGLISLGRDGMVAHRRSAVAKPEKVIRCNVIAYDRKARLLAVECVAPDGWTLQLDLRAAALPMCYRGAGGAFDLVFDGRSHRRYKVRSVVNKREEEKRIHEFREAIKQRMISFS